MAHETKQATPCATKDVVVVSPETSVVETEAQEKVLEPAVEEGEEKVKTSDHENIITEFASFKEESNNVDDLIDPEKKALDEFKLLVQEALNNHGFTALPPPPAAPAKEEEPKTEPDEEKIESCEPPSDVPASAEKKAEEKETPPSAATEEKVEAPEEIKETLLHQVTAPAPPPPCVEEEAAPPPSAEEVTIWGVPLLSDQRSDVILLKFLRARDFKVKEAFTMLKNVVTWRKEFKIDELLADEGISEGLEKVVYINGVDKEGHPVSYNAFGEFQDKELYSKSFSDAEKRAKFLRWYIQLLEKNIRKLDFSPEGICTIVQVTDLKNSPGLLLFKKELRQATSQALQLLQDNYPEFVAKQVFINVPWWYVAYNRMISPFLTQRTKSKFVFAGPTRTAETLFKYIAPEQVPVQYGGLGKEGEQDFTIADAAKVEIIKAASKHSIEFPITEAGTVVWQVRVVGWDISYGAEFVPSAEGGYTWIVQKKTSKIGGADEQALSCSFKIGEPGKVVLIFDNQTSKKKKLLYRSMTKPL